MSAAPLSILRAEGSVRAGIPSPADDFAVTRLDIGALLIKPPQATYLLRVAGPSMREFGIDGGDLVAVDRALQERLAVLSISNCMLGGYRNH